LVLWVNIGILPCFAVTAESNFAAKPCGLAVCMVRDMSGPWRPAGSQACSPVALRKPMALAAGAGRVPAGRPRAAGQPRARVGGLCAAGARAARPAARHHTEGVRPAAPLLLVRVCTGAQVPSARSMSCMCAGVTLHACVLAMLLAPASHPGCSLTGVPATGLLRPGECGLVREHAVCYFVLSLPIYMRCGEQARLRAATSCARGDAAPLGGRGRCLTCTNACRWRATRTRRRPRRCRPAGGSASRRASASASASSRTRRWRPRWVPAPHTDASHRLSLSAVLAARARAAVRARPARIALLAPAGMHATAFLVFLSALVEGYCCVNMREEALWAYGRRWRRT